GQDDATELVERDPAAQGRDVGTGAEGPECEDDEPEVYGRTEGYEPRTNARGWDEERGQREEEWYQKERDGHRSFLERIETRHVQAERGELAVDVIDHDPDDEDRDEQVQKDTDLGERRHGLMECQPHDEDPVFEDQVTDDLRDGFAPRGHHQKAG